MSMRRSLLVTGYVLVLGLFALLWTTYAPVPASAAAQPVVGAIPDAFLKGTMPAPKFSGEIKLGAMYPRTGVYSYLAEEAWRGVELAMKVQNSSESRHLLQNPPGTSRYCRVAMRA